MNQKYVLKFGMDKMLHIGLCLVLFSAVLLLIIGTQLELNPFLIQLIKTPASFGIALVLGNATTKAIVIAKELAGSGTAIISALQMGAGALGIAIISSYYDGTILPIAISMCLCTTIALIIKSKLN